MESNKIVDTEHIYTNGSEMVPIFRMRQWFQHIAAQKEQRWIPVTERLPEENLPVLVAVKQKDRLPKWVKEQTHSYVTDIDVYDDGSFYTHKNNVVAWMPLPMPYREDGNEQ